MYRDVVPFSGILYEKVQQILSSVTKYIWPISTLAVEEI